MDIDHEELKRLRAYAEEFKDRDWTWDDMEVDDDDGDRYVYVPQGGTLGDTLITLGNTYEGSGTDCEYIQLLLKYGPMFIRAMARTIEEQAASA